MIEEESYNELYDLCEANDLILDMNILAHAKKKPTTDSMLGLTVKNGKQVLARRRMLSPGTPDLGVLSMELLEELEQLGYGKATA